ncbi:MAG: sugar transferase, partial [Planctomycetota bacterium]
LSMQVLIDLLVVVLACLAAWWLRESLILRDVLGGVPLGEDSLRFQTELSDYREVFAITASVCLVCFHTFGLYSPSKSLLNVEEYKSVTKSTIVSFLVVMVLLFFLRDAALPTGGAKGIYAPLLWLHSAFELEVNPDSLSRFTILLSFVFILVFMTISRFASFRVIQRLHRRGIGNRNVLVVGAGFMGRRLQEKFLHVPTLGLNFVGFLDTDPTLVGTRFGRGDVLGTVEDLERVLGEQKVSEVFISLPDENEEEILAICTQLDRLQIAYFVVPHLYHLMSYNVRIENLDSIPLVTRALRTESVLSDVAKRLFDVLVSLVVLTLAAPLFFLFAFLIKRESKGPIFFRQQRVGLNGKSFRMVKFRTMFVDNCRDEVAPKDEYDPRVTRVGRVLRRYSFDELPNFWNVLLGQMSVVGPRPEMEFIVDDYGPLDRERLRAKPGVTGLWQISYARQDSIHSNIDYDLYYIENRSFLLDLVIVALTGFAVVKGTGAF